MTEESYDSKKYFVALYLRLSKEDGDKEESESITNQRKILRSYCMENNYIIHDEYIDDGYSGTNFNRPNFQRMINDINSGKVNMVITKNLARLGRDYIETGRYIETFFPEHDIRYIALLDDVDTFLDKNCDTVAFKNIMNDFYAKETSKNIKRTKNRKKQEGFYYTTYAPFGYKKVDIKGNLEIEPIAADVVKRIFNEFMSGKGTYQIAKGLNKDNITTPGIQMQMSNVVNHMTGTTNMWTHTAVKRILTNPAYIGTIIQNKRRKISYKSKKIVNIPEEDHLIIKNHHKAIINEDIFYAVQKKFDNCLGERIKENDPLLKSLLYCYHCHNKLSVIAKRDKYKDKVTTRYYIRCDTALRTVSNKSCYKQYINYTKLEKQVLDKISSVFEEYLTSDAFNNEELLKKLIDQKSNRGVLEEKLKRIAEQEEKVNKKLRTLYSDKLAGILEEQDYYLFSEELRKEKNQLNKVRKSTIKEIEELEKGPDTNKIEGKIKDVIKKILEEKEFKKEDLQKLVNKIEIDKDKNILIHFNFYELNCLGGHISYDSEPKAANM